MVAGDHFALKRTVGGKEYSLVVYSLSGKRIKATVVNKENVNLRKDVGIPAGAYIVRVNPIPRSR
jgi:hypothetical protein